MKQIIIEIGEDGEVKIDAVGYSGNACTKATEALIRAAGAKVTKEGKKPEYYQKTSVVQGH